MIKKSMILCSLVIVVLLSGCENVDKNIDQHTTILTPVPSNNEITKESITEVPEVSKQPTIVVSEQPATSNSEEEKINTEGEYVDNEPIGFLKLGLNDSEVESKLGKAEEKTDEQEWGADGRKHQQWYYKSKGIVLDMVRNGSNQLVNFIKVTDKCTYLTKRGIGIGSNKNDVFEKYKNEIDFNSFRENPEMIVAGSVYGGVIFTLDEKGLVTSIFIGAASE